MKNKSGKTMSGPTLQLFELVPVTDPAELEAIDRRCKAAEKAMIAAARKQIARKKGRGATLQEMESVPISDLIDLEAIDRRHKAAEKAMAAAAWNAGKREAPKRK